MTADLKSANKYIDGRPRILEMSNCRGLSLRGVSLVNSDKGTIGINTCENVLFDGITVRNNLNRINSDGMDII